MRRGFRVPPCGIPQRGTAFCLVAAFTLLSTPALAQSHPVSARPFAANVIVPQSRAFAVDRRAAAQITGVSVTVTILEQAATTRMDIDLKNPGGSRLEAELVVPVPEGAVMRGFTFKGAGSEPTATVLPKEEARKTYESLVAQVRDPALLEFIGYSLVRSSLFPIEANATQRVRLTYELLLPADSSAGGSTRIDYVLPRSESLEYAMPWNISVEIKSTKPIATLYSPSHRLDTKREGDNSMSARVAPDAMTEPGPFRLSCLLQEDGVSASLFAYPDPKVGGGYLLLLVAAPSAPPEKDNGAGIRREVTLVLDRSGSMHGEKIEQVREAAQQVLAGLEEGEAFNIITYNETVDLFKKHPVLKTQETVGAARAYLKGIQARGGTNIHEALVKALRQKPTQDMLPLVLFLTDGVPTVGETSEVAIRDVAIKANPHKRRIFTFGVGVDVNTPLLEKIATGTRGAPTFVLPKEDVEVKVTQVFKRLAGPTLADPQLGVLDKTGEPASGRVRDMIPAKLPDVFEGDQLIVLGQYVGKEPLQFMLSGNYLGKARTFRFTFDLDKSSTKNGFVPRLWASRKIAVLTDEIRQLGADLTTQTANTAVPSDPRMKELVDEIVRLSLEFGILTEYTAFLAREGTDLTRRDAVLRMANDNFTQRAVQTRVGLGSVNQSFNNTDQMGQYSLNGRNSFLDENMNRVSIATVQQVNDVAFYRRANRWVDSRLVATEGEVKPKRVVEFGSEDFRDLALKLAEDNRQGSIALRGDILLMVDNEPVLVKNTAESALAY